MKNIIKVLFCGLFFLSGCATNQLKVTYYADPASATLYEDQRAFGYTPLTLAYPITPQDRERGYMLLKGTSVVWASGASASVKSLRADLSQGNNFHFIFIRPDVPGIEVDLDFALQVEWDRILRQHGETRKERQRGQPLFIYEDSLPQ